MSNSPLAQLAANGVSIWLDDLSRSRIVSGGLRDLITNRSVSGVTTNPTIFAGALAKGEGYQAQVGELAAAGATAEQAIFEITTKDVADACDIFAGVYAASNGFDGRVSIEVEPGLFSEVNYQKPIEVEKAVEVVTEMTLADAIALAKSGLDDVPALAEPL